MNAEWQLIWPRKSYEVTHPVAKSEGEFGSAYKVPEKLKYKWNGPAWYVIPDE